MTAPSSTPGSSGGVPGEEPGGAVNEPADARARATAQPMPRSRRERRERERGNQPVRVVPALSIPIGEDGEAPEDDDITAVTPPPRPAPRAAAFKGLKIIEHRVDPDDAETSPDEPQHYLSDDAQLDAAPPPAAGLTASGPAVRVPVPPTPPAAPAPAAGVLHPSVVRKVKKTPAKRVSPPRPGASAFHDLAPAQWPSNDTFGAPKKAAAAKPAAKKPVAKKPGPRTAKKAAPAVETVVAEPAFAEPLTAEPVVAESVVAEPVVAEPSPDEPEAGQPEVAEPEAAVVPDLPEFTEWATADEIAREAGHVNGVEPDPAPALNGATLNGWSLNGSAHSDVLTDPVDEDPVEAEDTSPRPPVADETSADEPAADAPAAEEAVGTTTPFWVAPAPERAVVQPPVPSPAATGALAPAPELPAVPVPPAPAVSLPVSPDSAAAAHAAPAPAASPPAAPATVPPPANPAEVFFRDAPRRRAEIPTGARAATPARVRPPMGEARRLKAALYLVPILSTVAALAAGLLGAVTLIGHPVIGAVLLVTAAVVLTLVVLTASEANRAIPHPLIGSDLHRVDHVDLWAAVTSAADELGVETPVRIVVDGAARVSLSRRPSGSEMAIGLPLLLGLSEPELSALIIHELAHDALPGAAVHRLGERIDASIRRLSSDRRWTRRPTLLVMRWYGSFYRRLATRANERHELRADDAAARLTSGPITARAIGQAEVIRDRWQTLVEQYVPLAAIAHRRASLAAGLQSLLDAHARNEGRPASSRRGREQPVADDAEAPPTSDAHLSPGERAARLEGEEPAGGSATGQPTRTTAPATALLAHGEDDAVALERAMLPDSDPEPADWQTIVEIAAEHQVRERTAYLAWAMRELYPDQKVTLSTVLAAIADGRGPQIVEPLLRPGLTTRERPAAAQKMLEDLITAYVVTVLLPGGLAQYEVAWPGGIRLLRRSGNAWIAWDGGDAIRSGTADPAGIAALTRWLHDIQADLHVAAEPSDGPPLQTLSALSDLDLVHAFETSPVDLLVYRTGMLLARIEVPTPAARLAQQATGTLRRQGPAQVAGRRIVQLAEQLGESPEELPGSWWITFGSVVTSQVRERRSRTEIRLRLKDGATVVLETTNRTTSRGHAMEDLERLLPGGLAD